MGITGIKAGETHTYSNHNRSAFLVTSVRTESFCAHHRLYDWLAVTSDPDRLCSLIACYRFQQSRYVNILRPRLGFHIVYYSFCVSFHKSSNSSTSILNRHRLSKHITDSAHSERHSECISACIRYQHGLERCILELLTSSLSFWNDQYRSSYRFPIFFMAVVMHINYSQSHRINSASRSACHRLSLLVQHMASSTVVIEHFSAHLISYNIESCDSNTTNASATTIHSQLAPSVTIQSYLLWFERLPHFTSYSDVAFLASAASMSVSRRQYHAFQLPSFHIYHHSHTVFPSISRTYNTTILELGLPGSSPLN
ncbi:hypothetical protein MRB53_040047 [Persea americana]|nr:hypothetical protein MRB53_040047 [Persea americana]